MTSDMDEDLYGIRTLLHLGVPEPRHALLQQSEMVWILSL
jgi:hypothetical protein